MEEGAEVAEQEQDVKAALAVEATGLVKHYSGRSGDVEAVRGVDLAVRPGEVFGFLGPERRRASRPPSAC